MDDNLLRKASEDIKLIKQIIDRTSDSLKSFNRIFIWWGALFFGGYVLFQCAYPVIGYNFPFYIIANTLIYLFAFVIYCKVSRTAPLNGLSRQLMALWMSILVFIIVADELNNIFSDKFIDLVKPGNNYKFVSMDLILYAFGLFCTSILTNLKFPRNLAILYLPFGLFFLLPHPLVNYDFLRTSQTYSQIVHWIYIGTGYFEKLTFIIIGLYLEMKKVRGN